MLDVQAAVAHNTQACVHSNFPTGGAWYELGTRPQSCVMSPDGCVVAWKSASSIHVQHWRTSQLAASTPMPTHAEASALVWSSDSTCLAVWYQAASYQCVLVVDAHSGVAHQLSLEYCRSPDWEKPYNRELMEFDCGGQIAWAPNAPLLAVVCTCDIYMPQLEVKHVLCLINAAGPKPSFIMRRVMPECFNMSWAADSQSLSYRGSDNFFILDSASREVYKTEVPGSSCIAWSPNPQGASQWLCFTKAALHFGIHSPIFGQPCASLLNAKGQLQGSCSFFVDSVSHMVWGQHGLAVLSPEGVWLCDIVNSSAGFSINVRHHIPGAPFDKLVLSPDQSLIAFLQVTYIHHETLVEPGPYDSDSGFNLGYETAQAEVSLEPLVSSVQFVHALTGQSASHRLPESSECIPTCSWSRQSSSLSVMSSATDSHYLKLCSISFLNGSNLQDVDRWSDVEGTQPCWR